MRNPDGAAAPITRRRFGALAGGLFASAATGAACYLQGSAGTATGPRLTARPRAGVTTAGDRRRLLGLGSGRDAVLHLPATGGGEALPLLVLLHGAGGSGQRQLGRLVAAVEAASVAVLAPDSRGSTWDAIRADFGPDVAFLNQALERVFETTSIDPRRVAIGGFSDGATYALSLGLINGDLFQRILAFSPGFVVGGPTAGKPKVFVSHGTADPILPIDRCSRVIVPELKRRGYDVLFREFDGGHEVPAAIAEAGMSWVKG